MNPFQKPISVISGMSLVNKMLVIFGCLLFFILVVEQPGSPASKRLKGAKLLFPKLLASESSKVSLSNLAGSADSLTLSKDDGQWRIINGQSFPADSVRIERFLSILENMVGEQTVSNNPDRLSVFGLDEKTSPHAQVWDGRGRLVANFFVGRKDSEGRFHVKKSGVDEAILVNQDFSVFLLPDPGAWKDKTLISVSEKDSFRVALSRGSEETILEKKGGQWAMTSPEGFDADPLAVRTLFDLVKDFRADRIADSLEGSQANFDKPDYRLSIRLADNSEKTLTFSSLKDNPAFYAKNGDRNLIYVVPSQSVDNLFGLKLKAEKPTH